MLARIGNSCYDESGVDMGVSQGSTLGLVLFILFINDLSNCFDMDQLTIFADDTSVTVVLWTTADLLLTCQTLMNTFVDWCHTNALIVNIHKI